MTIRKGYCPGCPFNMNDPLTHDAYNLGCLPSVAEVSNHCRDENKAWACHSEPGKVCCGYAAQEPKRVDLPLLHVEGVHYPMRVGTALIVNQEGMLP